MIASVNRMRSAICVLLGYLLGSASPAALIGRIKKKDLRTHGTGNLGATNAMLVFGKLYGVIVMVIDIAKAYLSAKTAAFLFPKMVAAGLLAGFGAMLGHIFPFYLNFQGGKGLAAFAGMILAYHPLFFVIMAVICIVVMFIVDYTYAVPMTAAVLFPLLVAIHSRSLWAVLVTAAASALLVQQNWCNIDRAKRGDETGVRQFLSEDLKKIN